MKVVKQAEAADLETGKFLMELGDPRVLPVIGKRTREHGGRRFSSTIRRTNADETGRPTNPDTRGMYHGEGGEAS